MNHKVLVQDVGWCNVVENWLGLKFLITIDEPVTHLGVTYPSAQLAGWILEEIYDD